MPRGSEPRDDDAQEALVDKLRCGEYGELVTAAQKSAEAQLCVQAGGGVAKADPHRFFANAAASNAPAAQEEDPEAELRRLRQERVRQMQEERLWQQQGHGELRELRDEREFVREVKPHGRAVMLLEDLALPVAGDVRRAFARLARAHMEALFCTLQADRAVFLTHMVELQGLPAIFILRNGEVTRQIRPSQLFEYASASSPLFPKHLARLLERAGGITSAEGASSSEGEDDEDERDRRRTPGFVRR